MADVSSERSDGDSPETPINRSRISRILWNVAGSFFLSLGIVGIAIPLLPTTPFLLLAAACYLRGSERMYKWMLTNRYFGSYLRNYRQGRGMPWRVKIATVSLLWIVIGFSAIVVTDNMIVRIVLLVVALGVSIHILTIKAKRI
jgi:uncharacterized membrane protein YbaN (DUF454 family)